MVSKIETNPNDVDWPALLDHLRQCFAYMADRIDPPSSLTRMTLEGLVSKAENEDLFLIRSDGDLIACLFGAPCNDAYYLGKLAVAQEHRGEGLAGALVEMAADHATALGFLFLELESRVELTENHAAFTSMGFVRTGETAHPGYTRPTSYTFRRPVSFPRREGGL